MNLLIEGDRRAQRLRLKSPCCCTPLENYTTIRKVGDGTFGEVTLCQQVKSGRYVALKKIRPSGADGQEGSLVSNDGANLGNGLPITSLREIKVLKKLQHKSIVPLIDMAYKAGDSSKRVPGFFSIVFPFVEHDLKGLLENKNAILNASRIKCIVRQIGEGLAYLHRGDILHRDLKLANVLVSNRGVVRLADFGLARPEYINNGPLTGNVVTLWYRPPEVLLGATKYGDRLDMWGLGCILGELLTGSPLLPGSTEIKQLELICKLCGSPDYDAQYPQFRALAYGEVVRVRNPVFDRSYDECYRALRKRQQEDWELTMETAKRKRLDSAEEREEGEVVESVFPVVLEEGEVLEEGAANEPLAAKRTSPKRKVAVSKPSATLDPENLPFDFPPRDEFNKPRASPVPLYPRRVSAVIQERAIPDAEIDSYVVELCSDLLQWKPSSRPSALELLRHSWFFVSPLPAKPDSDHFWGAVPPSSSHEMLFRSIHDRQ